MSKAKTKRKPQLKKDRLIYIGILHTKDAKTKICERIYRYPKPVVMHIADYEPQRTIDQNSLFHLWCRQISEHYKMIGENVSAKHVKLKLKVMFLGTYKIEYPDGSSIVDICHSSDLGPSEMYDFMSQIQEWAENELDLYLDNIV